MSDGDIFRSEEGLSQLVRDISYYNAKHIFHFEPAVVGRMKLLNPIKDQQMRFSIALAGPLYG